MDDLDSNIILEVPDTPPDRLDMSRNKPRFKPRVRYLNHHDLVRNNNSSSNNASKDVDFFFREANIARELNKDMEPKGTAKSGETIDLSCDSPYSVSNPTSYAGQSNGVIAQLKSRDKGKRVENVCNNPKGTNASKDVDFFFREANIARELNKDMEPKGTVKSGETIDLSCDSPYSVSNPTSYAGQSNGVIAQLKSRDKGKRVENVCNNPKGKNGFPSSSSGNGFPSSSSGTNVQSNEKITIGPRRPVCGQRKLVQNGCISPINIERKKNTGKQKEKEVVVISPEPHVCNISPDSQNIQSDEMGKKITVDDIIAEKEQSVKDRCNSNSVHLAKESTSIAAGGWRTTRNHTRKPKLVQDFQDLRIETGENNGKRKLSSFRGHNEECSSSGYKTTEGSNVGSSGQILHPRSTRRQRTQCAMGPVIEVDDLQSPEVESRSVRRNSQLISDEILARQLQEELYNETPTAVNTTEIDESVALWLQHHDELNAEQTRPPRVTQRRARNASSGSNYPPPRRISRLAFLREFYRTRPNTMMEMANHNVDAGVTRLNNFLHTQRDFNEDDYEMLLSLDENNHQHGGASQSQINNLPQSTIQNANSDEPCAVCLEPPAIGDTVRHLPCLHKFHKDCIDAWLKRKRVCPICKSDIR